MKYKIGAPAQYKVGKVERILWLTLAVIDVIIVILIMKVGFYL